jgi:hypothetical protein
LFSGTLSAATTEQALKEVRSGLADEVLVAWSEAMTIVRRNLIPGTPADAGRITPNTASSVVERGAVPEGMEALLKTPAATILTTRARIAHANIEAVMNS